MNDVTFFKSKGFTIAPFIFLSALALACSVKCVIVATIISIVGSIASLFAIWETFTRMKSIELQNKEIKNAVETKMLSVNKYEIVEQVNKYVEVIARILSYIEVRNAEAAILKIEELQIFLHGIQCNPTTSSEAKKILHRHHRTIKQDVLVLRDKSQYEPFPKDADCKELAKHFEDLRDTLMLYSQQIHFEK